MTVPATVATRWVLLALAIGAFAIGTTEFAPMGLLPLIAAGTGVSIPRAGVLVSAYAIGVMVGAPVMTLLFSRFGKRAALIALMSLYIVGNLLSAVAPNYWSLLAARVITSLNHGAFFGLGSVVAASVVPKEKQGSAVATMFMGLTIANVGGVPAATWVGQQVGWRISFAAMAVIGALTILALGMALPKGVDGQRPDVKRELGVLLRPQVLSALLTTVMGASAMFTLFTYITPLLQTLTHATDAFVTFALVLIGVGFTIGNWLGGRAADWSVDGATALFLSAMGVIMLVSVPLLGSPVSAAVVLVLWGSAAFGVVTPVQTRVMQVATGAPGLASSINIGAFNLGNAIGAAVGGAVLSLGLGYRLIPVAGGVLALAGAGLVGLAHRARR